MASARPADNFFAEAINGIPRVSHKYAQTCLNSPEVKSVADAFLIQYDPGLAEVLLRRFLIFLDSVHLIDARSLHLGSSVDREERKAQAIVLLRQAIKLLDFSYDIVRDYSRSSLDRELPIARRKQTARKLLKRIASDFKMDRVELLRVLADEIDHATVDDLMPVGNKDRYPNCDIDLSNIGLSGRAAASPKSATRGLLVKELVRRLPDSMKEKYAVIEKLLAIKGIDLSRQDIRGILLKGKT